MCTDKGGPNVSRTAIIRFQQVQRKTPFRKLPQRVQAANKRSTQSKDCYFEEKSFSPAKRVCEFARCQQVSCESKFYVAHFIGESGRPFTDDELVKKGLIKVVQETCPDKLPCIGNVSLSARTITRRVEDISEHLHETLKESEKFFKYFSLATDESNHTTDTAQMLTFIRVIRDAKFRITEDLCSLRSLKSTATAENIFSEVTTALSSLGLSWKNLKSTTTDGARRRELQHS